MSLERARSRRRGYEREIFKESRSARELVRGEPDDDLMITEAVRTVREEDNIRRMYLEHERAMFRDAYINTPSGRYEAKESIVVRKRVIVEKDP